MEHRTRSGERTPDVLRGLATKDLIAALAVAGTTDEVAANAIATELLNRETRAPFLGAALASMGFVLSIFLVDMLLTSTPFWQLAPSVARGYITAAIGATMAIVSAIMYLSWRGHMPGIQRLAMWARTRRGRSF